ncbi:hypothetical protein L1987_50196 [Smallanthus sonchifolius]|uniref:Uncharacterized protein n=1 Tax=Smallanthus sonchifolius TaxID=185202 RepID=A0ACB9FXQ3_9ASTR|nr:hypothetical protein L1987_50196 [Smallanthus sonchifolius]
MHGLHGGVSTEEVAVPKVCNNDVVADPTSELFSAHGCSIPRQEQFLFSAQSNSDSVGPGLVRRAHKCNKGKSSLASRGRDLDLNSKLDDPFDLDNIILASSVLGKSKRKRFTADISNKFLNSEGDPGKRLRSLSFIPAEREIRPNANCDGDDGVSGATSVFDVEKEVEETIVVGESVVIVMDSFHNHVRKLVQGEMESSRFR